MELMPARTPLHRAFCANVRARRLQLGWTQEETAKKLGISQPAYAAIESGKAAPTITQIERVSEALKIAPALLLAAQELAVA